MALQFRHGLEADLDLTQLEVAEPVYTDDSKKAFIGDGAGGAMPIGNMFTNDFANGSGESNNKAVDKSLSSLSSNALKSTFRLAFSNFPVGTTFEWDGPTAPAGTLFKDGSAVSRTTYAALLAALIGTVTVTQMTTGSAALTVSDTSNLYQNEAIEGVGIQAGTTVLSITDATHLTLSKTATTTRTTGTITYFPWGNGDGSTTFNLPNATGVVSVGRDRNQSEFKALGQKGGVKTQAYGLSANGFAEVSSSGANIYIGRETTPSWASNAAITGASGTNISVNQGAQLGGSTDSGNNLQPYNVINQIIVY